MRVVWASLMGHPATCSQAAKFAFGFLGGRLNGCLRWGPWPANGKGGVLERVRAAVGRKPRQKQRPEIPCVVIGLTDPEKLRNACATVSVGLTSAHCLLARTGRIALLSTPRNLDCIRSYSRFTLP